MDAAIETAALRRDYPGRGRSAAPVTALHGLDLVVGRGETHGLLGPNGAGKTTLVKILATILTATAGTARVAGWDVARQPQQVRAEIGIVLGGDRGLYTRLSARQNLHFWAAAARVERRRIRPRTDELVERLGLTGWADKPVETYSRGMKQRLHLARGLIGEPAVLILDEPTAGMDPVAGQDFRALMREVGATGTTTLLATHDMAEAEELCDRVTMIDRGRALFSAPTRDVGHLFGRSYTVRFGHESDRVAQDLAAQPGVASVQVVRPGWWTAEVEADALPTVTTVLLQAGVRDLVAGPPSLEQVYLDAVGDRGLRL